MKRASSRLAVLLAVVMIAGCTSTKIDLNKWPKLSDITTPTNAKRALVIAQDARVTARDLMAKRIAADGVVTPDEAKTVARFDTYDAQFTQAWDVAYRATVLWEMVPRSPRPQSFDNAWVTIDDLVKGPNAMGGIQ